MSRGNISGKYSEKRTLSDFIAEKPGFFLKRIYFRGFFRIAEGPYRQTVPARATGEWVRTTRESESDFYFLK